MFMAVAERVREIGLKKAVGATTLNVMGEFLIEAAQEVGSKNVSLVERCAEL